MMVEGLGRPGIAVIVGGPAVSVQTLAPSTLFSIDSHN